MTFALQTRYRGGTGRKPQKRKEIVLVEIKHSDGRVEVWSREDLEGVDWTHLEDELGAEDDYDGNPDDGPGIFDSYLGYALAYLTQKGVEQPCGDLMAAAPELALACLEARRVFLLQAADADRAERASLEPTIEALDAALALAGVQP